MLTVKEPMSSRAAALLGGSLSRARGAIPNCDQEVRLADALGEGTRVIVSTRFWPQAQRRNPQLPKWRLLRRPKAGRLAVTASRAGGEAILGAQAESATASTRGGASAPKGRASRSDQTNLIGGIEVEPIAPQRWDRLL